MEFKDRIKAIRNERGLTQTQLASQLGKGESAIRMWEIGRSKPDADTLIKLADYFGCTTDYLLGLSEYRNLEELDSTIEIEKNLDDLYEMLSETYKSKYRNLTISILASFILTSDDDNAEAELFGNYVGHLKYMADFYNTRYGCYNPETFDDDAKTKEDLAKVRIVAAFELSADGNSLVRDILGVEEDSEMDKQLDVDFEKLKLFYKEIILPEKSHVKDDAADE